MWERACSRKRFNEWCMIYIEIPFLVRKSLGIYIKCTI